MRALFTQHKKNKEEKWVIFCAFVLCLSLLSRFPRSLLSLSPLKRSETQRKSTGNKTWKQRLGYCVLFFLLHFNGTERKRSGSENEAKEKKDKEPNTRHPGKPSEMNGLCEKMMKREPNSKKKARIPLIIHYNCLFPLVFFILSTSFPSFGLFVLFGFSFFQLNYNEW